MSKVEPNKPVPNTNEKYIDYCPKCGGVISELGLCERCGTPAEETPHEIVPPIDPYGKVGKVRDRDQKGAPTHEDDAPVHGDKDVSNK